MLRDRVIICLASAWDYDPTSKHQIMRRLARHNDIVWVNYHGTRRPGVNLRDARAAWSALRRALGGVRRVHDSMVQVTPLVIPGTHGGPLHRLHEQLLVTQIRRALRGLASADRKPVQVWSFAPDVPYLVGRFGEECFVYYCVDEYSEFEGVDRERTAAAEQELLQRADIVVTTSALLQEGKCRLRPDAHLVRHGVDFEHFAAAWRRSLPRPADLSGIPEPIFGFFGLIHHWVDCALLAEVARLRPQYSFVLLGDAQVDVSALRALPNVHLLGRRPYKELPAYCRAFAAGMLLFTQTAMTAHVNPIKMLEYLAAGLGVISTPLPEAERYRGPIRIVESAGEFARACDELRAGGDLRRREEISRRVQTESWESVVERLSRIVLTQLGQAPVGAAADTSVCAEAFSPALAVAGATD
ncbi:MAG TPA: glycosyltransferase [Phycisphaerae bacterium]|nr:glycosyltransferase [Phycisphaerae bacterium]HNU43686.1 glycosyltransferase [Phycisphaerae bacterium]